MLYSSCSLLILVSVQVILQSGPRWRLETRSTRVSKKLIFFFYVLNRFDALMSKIIFLK